MVNPENTVAGFFSDNSGSPSFMRLMALIALIIAAAFGALAILKDSQTAFDLSMIWIIAAFTGKVAQKFSERNPCCEDKESSGKNPE